MFRIKSIDLEQGFTISFIFNVRLFPAGNYCWKLTKETLEQGVKYVQS